MDPMIASSLISGASGVLGSMFGGDDFSKKDNEWLMHHQHKYKALDAQWIPKAQVEGWRRAGIHPLAGLGMASPSASGSAVVGTGSRGAGDAIQAAGQGISRAVAAYASREEREMAKASAALQLENQQLQNDRLRSEIALMHQPGLPPGLSSLGQYADARYPTQRQQELGFGDSAPVFRRGIDSAGDITRFLNDDLTDSEAAQAATFLMFTAPDWFHSKVTQKGVNHLYDLYRLIRYGKMNRKIKERR